MKTAELLAQRLERVYRWYGGMVNRDTGMLEYLYNPKTDTFLRKKSPIRDIASVWDVEMLGDFLNRHELRSLVEKSLQHYDDYLMEREGHLILDPGRLEEPSSIAHSAFMILVLLHAPPPNETRRSQQIVLPLPRGYSGSKGQTARTRCTSTTCRTRERNYTLARVCSPFWKPTGSYRISGICKVWNAPFPTTMPTTSGAVE